MIKSLLLVSLGASFGASFRFICYHLLPSSLLATFFVNSLGSFLLGVLTFWANSKSPSHWSTAIHLILGVGFLGSFTTFSTLSREMFLLLETHWLKAISIGMGQVAAGLGLFLIGWKLTHFFMRT